MKVKMNLSAPPSCVMLWLIHLLMNSKFFSLNFVPKVSHWTYAAQTVAFKPIKGCDARTVCALQSNLFIWR